MLATSPLALSWSLVGRGITAPSVVRRTNGAHPHLPRRATSEYATAAKRRRFCAAWIVQSSDPTSVEAAPRQPISPRVGQVDSKAMCFNCGYSTAVLTALVAQ